MQLNTMKTQILQIKIYLVNFNSCVQFLFNEKQDNCKVITDATSQSSWCQRLACNNKNLQYINSQY